MGARAHISCSRVPPCAPAQRQLRHVTVSVLTPPSCRRHAPVCVCVLQLLEFSRTVLEDLSNYDPTAAWPVALDDFVEHIRRSSAKK